MDLRAYYRKIRRIEEQIEETDVVVESCQTPDGGRAGVLSEVPRQMAARLVVDGRARLASEDAATAYREGLERARRQALEEQAARRVEVSVVPSGEVMFKRGDGRPARGREKR